MIWDHVENITQLAATVLALFLCVYYYIKDNKRGWIYAFTFFLCGLLSSYYWTSYFMIMGDAPGLKDALTYFGWNIAFFMILLIVLHFKSPEERRCFHPIMHHVRMQNRRQQATGCPVSQS